MSDTRNDPQNPDSDRKLFESVVRLAVVALVAYWCFAIFRPFLIPLVWGVVLAVALRPAYARIEHMTGGRRKLAATVLVVLCLGVLAVPVAMLSGSMIDGVRLVSRESDDGELRIPPAPDRVAEWPVVGPTIHETWDLASTNLESVLQRFRPQVKAFRVWLVTLAKQTAAVFLLTAVALVIAAVLLTRRESAAALAIGIGGRIAGDRGGEAVRIAGKTIASVANGVVGVAAIQAVLAALGLALAGVPGAGLWALLVLVLAVAQLPPLLVLGPVILYLVATDASMVTIVLFSLWSLVVTVSDAFLKPLLLGRGSGTPVPVLLIGAIGGLMLHGLIGLFVGAVVFSTGYRLFGQWMTPSGDAAALPAAVPPSMRGPGLD